MPQILEKLAVGLLDEHGLGSWRAFFDECFGDLLEMLGPSGFLAILHVLLDGFHPVMGEHLDVGMRADMFYQKSTIFERMRQEHVPWA